MLAYSHAGRQILQQESRPQYLPLKIFSDIDDTYLAGWLDTPIGNVYEGTNPAAWDNFLAR